MLLKVNKSDKKPLPKYRKSHANILPSDAYPDLVESQSIKISEHSKVVLSSKRGGEYGLPLVDLRLFVEKAEFTGFTKKGINLQVEHIPELIRKLEMIYNDLDKLDLIDDSNLDEYEESK